MQLRGILAVLPYVIFLTASAALGADLSFSAESSAAYDSNVFRSEDDEEDDFLFRLRPGIRVHEDRGDDITYSFAYELPIEFALENNRELQDFDHVARARVDYHVSDQLTLFLSDDLRFLRSTLRREQTGENVIGDSLSIATVQDERDRVTLNDGTVGARYLVTPRLVVNAIASSNYFETTREDRSDNYSFGGTVDTRYALTARHQIGIGGRYVLQEFEGSDRIEGSRTNIIGGFASWRWVVSNTLRLEVRGGPSYIDTEQDDSDRFRSALAVPTVRVLNGTETIVAVDSTGAPTVRGPGQVAGPVAPGSLLVPINCNRLNNPPVPVADGCTTGSSTFGLNNLVLDRGNGADAADIAAIQGTQTLIANADPRGEDDAGIDFFVDATITQQWTPNLTTALQYTRQQGNAAGLGGTVIADFLSLSNDWQFLERWRLTLRGDWTRSTSTFRASQTFDNVFQTTLPNAAQPIATRCAGGGALLACPGGTSFNANRSSDVDTSRWGVAGRVTHQLFRNTLVFGQLRYDRQDSDTGTLGNASDFENIVGTIGVRHSFEPISLW
ncbi:MAG: hypothetical protein AAF430_23400 [Myxococcota bacterium]